MDHHFVDDAIILYKGGFFAVGEGRPLDSDGEYAKCVAAEDYFSEPWGYKARVHILPVVMFVLVPSGLRLLEALMDKEKADLFRNSNRHVSASILALPGIRYS